MLLGTSPRTLSTCLTSEIGKVIPTSTFLSASVPFILCIVPESSKELIGLVKGVVNSLS